MGVHDASAATDHIARARELSPMLTAAGPHIDAACELPPDVLDAMHAQGMFRLLVPRSIGGASWIPRPTSSASKRSPAAMPRSPGA